VQKSVSRAARGRLIFVSVASGLVATSNVGLLAWHLAEPDGRNWLDTWYPLLMAVIFAVVCVSSLVGLRGLQRR
jgi:hypothetical protein